MPTDSGAFRSQFCGREIVNAVLIGGGVAFEKAGTHRMTLRADPARARDARGMARYPPLIGAGLLYGGSRGRISPASAASREPRRPKASDRVCAAAGARIRQRSKFEIEPARQPRGYGSPAGRRLTRMEGSFLFYKRKVGVPAWPAMTARIGFGVFSRAHWVTKTRVAQSKHSSRPL